MLRILKASNEIMFLSASLSTGTDPEPIYTAMYIAFKLSENKCCLCWHETLLVQLQYSLCAIACLLFIHANRLIFLLDSVVLIFNHCINIPYKVLKCYSTV